MLRILASACRQRAAFATSYLIRPALSTTLSSPSSPSPACRSQYQQTACMAYDSKNKTHQQIHELITKNKKSVVVFMKGDPEQPLCSYSGLVVQILNAYGVDFDSYNVLDNQDVRNEIKTYSDWPTIPQVYKDGKFVGGCDILMQMHENKEIEKFFSVEELKPN